MSTATEQQQAIVNAALGLLADGGPNALRVRDIAEAAGCTTMTVYSRFGGKDGVVDAIYIDGFTRFTHALETSDSGEESLRMGMAYRAWALENPGSYRVMFTEAVPGFVPSAAAQAVATKAFDVLVGAVEKWQQHGTLRAGSPIEIAWAIWGAAHGMVMLELADMRPEHADSSAEQAYGVAMQAVVGGFT